MARTARKLSLAGAAGMLAVTLAACASGGGGGGASGSGSGPIKIGGTLGLTGILSASSQEYQAVYQDWDDVRQQIPALRSVPKKDLAPVNFGHPYHAGAVRFFKEVGLWTPAHEARQEKLLKEEGMKE